MPSLTKRELKKIQKRLDFIYEKLDGKPKLQKTGDGPQDEFSNVQMYISEEIIRIRNKIQLQKKEEKSREGYVRSLRLKKELESDITQLEDNLDKMRSLLNTIRESPKISQDVKNNRTVIFQKFEELVNQLKRAIRGEEVEFTPIGRPVTKLKDLKGQFNQNNPTDTRADIYGQDDPDDQRVLNMWNDNDKIIDGKLDDLNVMLDELKEMNNNLTVNIEQRGELINTANKKAEKTNKEIESQNKTLAAVLKAYRSPGRICMDICLFVLLFGLIAVIIMLAVNGK